MIASIILIVFVTVFIMYSNRFSPGVKGSRLVRVTWSTEKDRKMLFYENLIIGVTVLIIGILIGTLLSKLFAMILIKLGTPVQVGMAFSSSSDSYAHRVHGDYFGDIDPRLSIDL